MKIRTAVVVLLVGLAWFGRSAWGGYVLADESPSMDIYHLSTIWERWGDALLRGVFPAWLPEFAAGYPAPASWMYGLWSPGNLLFAVLPADAAWTWTALLHLVLGAVGVHRLVADTTEDDVAAWTAGLVFGLSEFLIGRTLYGHLNLVAPVAWIPWVFVHLRGVAVGRPHATAWLAVCTALGVLAGHVQVWFYVVPAALAYALVLWRDAATPRRYVLHLAGAAAFVVAVTSPQWLSTVELSALSDRPAASSADVRDFSAPAYVLVAKLFPGALGHPGTTHWGPSPADHEFGAVGGLFLLALSLPALRGRRREDVFFAALAVAGIALAPGVHNPLSDLLNAVPPMRWGRTPGRALILTTFALAVLAGRGLAAWRAAAADDDPSRLKRVVRATAGTTAVALVLGSVVFCVLVRNHGLDAHARLVARAIVTSAVLAAGVLALPLVARTRPRAWFVAPGVVVVSALLGGMPPARSIPSGFYTQDWASALPADVRAHRIHLLSGRLPSVERQGLRTLRDICYVDARWYHEFAGTPTPARAAWLDVGIELAGLSRERVFAGTTGPEDLQGRPYRALGPGLVFDRPAVEPDDARVLSALDGGALQLYLPEPPPGVAAGASRTIDGATVTRVASPSPVTTAFDVDTPVAGWLWVSEKFYPGWECTVAGAPATIHRANVTFRAVQVPAGRSRVTFVYRPWTVRVGVWLAVAALLAGGIAWTWSWRRTTSHA